MWLMIPTSTMKNRRADTVQSPPIQYINTNGLPIGNDSADLMIAVKALVHGLAVATRIMSHFTPTGVAITNPFDD